MSFNAFSCFDLLPRMSKRKIFEVYFICYIIWISWRYSFINRKSFFIRRCYIVTFLFETGLKNYRKNLLVFLIICLIYFYIETEVLRYFRPALLKFGLWGPLFAYTSILSALNISSAIYAYCYRNIYSILAYIGSIIFYISDCILAKQLFFGYNKYHQITIMFTYILGQSLISLGMANKANSFELGIINDSLKKII